MRTINIYLFIATFLIVPFEGMAQKKVQFGGAGRVIMNYDRLGGDLIDSDTTTARRSYGGYAQFDLGIDIRPNENTQIYALTRVRSELDGFWGAGIAFQVRQLYAKGIMAKKLRYTIGDINTSLTPYTLYNSKQELSVNESAIFEIYRGIIDYENFYEDSTWRLQGVDLDFALNFDKGIEEMTIRGLIAKNRQTDFFFLPDRLFSLAELQIKQGKYGFVNFNYVNLFEVSKTAQFGEGQSSNWVLSGNFEIGNQFGDIDVRLAGEIGGSKVTFKEIEGAPENFDDSYAEIGVKLDFKKANLKAHVKFQDVGSQFRSAAAQSRRLEVNATNETFPFIGNREIKRPVSIQDITRDETIYNRNISTELVDFNPIYDNVSPYGMATPNRRGVHLNLEYMDSETQFVSAFINNAFLAEIRGQGTEEKRRFMSIKAGVDVHIDKIISHDKLITVTLGSSYQNTSRDGSAEAESIDLSSTFIEAGLQWEAFDNFDVLAGIRYLTASGNEFIADRDGFNQIVFYSKFDADVTQSLTAAGLRYRFSEDIELTAQYHRSNWDDKLQPSLKHYISQVYVIYNMYF